MASRSGRWFRRNRKNVFRASIAAAIAAVFVLGGLIVHNERDRVRLDAVNQQQAFNKQIQSTDVYAHVTRVKNTEEMRRARVAVEERIRDYQVLSDPQWKELPAIANLEPETRAILLQDMGQVLISLAQNQLVETRSTKQDLDKVRLYCDRAEDCYPSGQAPRVLWEMRADLADLSHEPTEAGRLHQLAAETPVESTSDRLMLAMYDFSKGRLNQAIPAFSKWCRKIRKTCWHGAIWAMLIFAWPVMRMPFHVSRYASRWLPMWTVFDSTADRRITT